MQESENTGKNAFRPGCSSPAGSDRWTMRKLFWIILAFAVGYAVASLVYTRIVGWRLTEGELFVKYWYIYASYLLIYGVVYVFTHLMEKETKRYGDKGKS